MPPQNFQWHNERVRHEIIVHPCVEYLYCPVIRRRREERVRRVEVERPNRLRMVPQILVRFVAQLQIEPAEFPVVPADNQVIARWVDVHGRDPFDSRHERLQQLLLGKVVHPHISLRCDEELWSGRMEEHHLDGPLDFLEGRLRMAPRYLMNPDAALAFTVRN